PGPGPPCPDGHRRMIGDSHGPGSAVGEPLGHLERHLLAVDRSSPSRPPRRRMRGWLVGLLTNLRGMALRRPGIAMVIRVADSGEPDTLIEVQEKATLESLSGIFGPEHPLPTHKIALGWREAFARPENRFAVCERGARVVGVTMVPPPWLHALQVLPEHSGRGVGAALHDDAITAIRAARA